MGPSVDTPKAKKNWETIAREKRKYRFGLSAGWLENRVSAAHIIFDGDTGGIHFAGGCFGEFEVLGKGYYEPGGASVMSVTKGKPLQIPVRARGPGTGGYRVWVNMRRLDAVK